MFKVEFKTICRNYNRFKFYNHDPEYHQSANFPMEILLLITVSLRYESFRYIGTVNTIKSMEILTVERPH